MPAASSVGPGAEHRLVDLPRPLRPAADQHGRPVRVEPERRAGRTAYAVPVVGRGELGDGPAQRQPDTGRVRQRSLRERGVDVRGDPGRELVGQPGEHVLLVDHDRDAQRPRRQIGRGGDVAAEADQDAGPVGPQQPDRGGDRSGQPGSDQGQVDARAARHRHRWDQLQPQTGGRHHGGLEAAGGAQSQQGGLRGQPPQLVGRGDQRRGVPGGAPAGQHDRTGPGRARAHRAARPDREPVTVVTRALGASDLRASSLRAAGSRRAQLSSTPMPRMLAISAEPP